MGSLTITHPYHPLKGQTYDILQIRKKNGERRYSLRIDNDVICVPESWTDRSVLPKIESSGEISLPFNVHDLLELTRLLKAIMK